MAQYLIQQAQVWSAMVPFGEVADGKDRPIVVLGWSAMGVADDKRVLVVPSATFGGDASKARNSDLSLSDWGDAGLGAGSFVQCARLWSLSPGAIDFGRGLKGSLSGPDFSAVMTEVAKLFDVSGFQVV